MRSDPTALDGASFDFVVIGGGIQGAALARELALRGASTALVERGDFACGTSMRSSRLIHGGVRYLQQGHIALVREALAERERLLRLAPHLVRPLPMLMPFFRDGGGLHPWLMRTGLRLYAWLARGSTLPAPRYRSADDCGRLFPGLRRACLRGGSLFFDARTEDLRLTLAVLEAARDAGARLCNHTELTGVDAEGRLVLRDRIGDRDVALRTRHVINAAGPRADAVRRRLGIDGADLVRTTRGSHVVLPPRDCETALGAFLPDGRIQFVVPHPDGTLVGTTDVDAPAGDDEPAVPAEDIAYFEAALRHLLDPAPAAAEFCFAYAGLRALPVSKGPSGALHREAFTVTERCAAGAVSSVVGGKLTTHRSFAERTVNALLGRRDASPSRHAPLPGGAGPADFADPLWWRHGSRARHVRELIGERPDLGAPIAPDRDLLRAEAVFALREQGAVTFTDLVMRRLFDTRGPSLDDGSLRALYELYREERTLDLGGSFEADRDDLLHAIAATTGARDWRPRAGARATARTP